MLLLHLLAGAVFAGVIAVVAFRARALALGGAIAAFVVGMLTFASGTIGFALVLLAFFVPSVILSRRGRARKRELVDIGKGGARDALQVLANGGVATACAVVWAFNHDIHWAVAFAGAYAASTADTWATEIGTLAPGPPRSILTGRPLPTGMSGGITKRGTLAELAGALWIGIVAPPAIIVAYVFGSFDFGWSLAYDNALQVLALVIAIFGAAIFIGGVAGATVDSLLGATLQELRRCDVCDRTCETNPHTCGNPTRRVRGLSGISNDAVNFAATLTGAIVAPILYTLLAAF
jgi:uncharacterized protein (TIGR00297 family)